MGKKQPVTMIDGLSVRSRAMGWFWFCRFEMRMKTIELLHPILAYFEPKFFDLFSKKIYKMPRRRRYSLPSLLFIFLIFFIIVWSLWCFTNLELFQYKYMINVLMFTHFTHPSICPTFLNMDSKVFLNRWLFLLGTFA